MPTIDPATRTANLLTHLGWSGGTIHQIAQVANEPVEWLLYADFDGAYNTLADRHGQAANIGRTVGLCITPPGGQRQIQRCYVLLVGGRGRSLKHHNTSEGKYRWN